MVQLCRACRIEEKMPQRTICRPCVNGQARDYRKGEKNKNQDAPFGDPRWLKRAIV